MKKTNIIEVLTIIAIVLSAIYVGTPIKYNCIEINIAIIIIGTIYILYKKIIKKEKIISCSIDIILLLFLVTPIIPLIFKTYDSLTETITSLLINISNYNIYIIIKNMLNKQKENSTKIIINTIIICGVIIALLGIDEMGANWTKDIKETIGIPPVKNIEHRMFSTIGYANSFAIVMAVGVLLSLNKTEKGKEIYSGLTFLFMSCLLFSYSRGTIIITILGYAIYLILSRKDKNKCDILVLAVNVLLSIIYMKIFNIIISTEKYIMLWIMLIIFMTISILITKIFSLYYEKILKIRKEIYWIICAIGIILMVILYIIGKQLDVPLHIFNENESAEDVKYIIDNVESDKEYTFLFDIDAKSEGYKTNHYSIEIVEENKYYDSICTHKFEFCNYTGVKKMQFTTNPETVEIAIYFKNSIKDAQRGVTINNLYINKVKHPLKYAYLPERVVSKIDSLKTKNKSVWERVEYYKDSLKIIKDNWLFGTGGQGWKYNYKSVQSYNYNTTEAHSYITKIFIENGIIAITIFMIITIYTVIVMIEKIKNGRFSLIDMTFIILMIHSFMDIDLSIYCISVIGMVLFTLVISNEKDKELKKNINMAIIILILVVNILTLAITGKDYRKDNTNENFSDSIIKEKDEDIVEKIVKYMKNENPLYVREYLKYVNDYSSISDENLQELYEYLAYQKNVVDTDCNMEKNDIIYTIFSTIENKEMSKKFASIIINENDEMIKNIENNDKNRLSKIEVLQYKEKQKRIFEEAKNVYER